MGKAPGGVTAPPSAVNNQAALQGGLANISLPAYQTGSNYWNSIIQGGPQAQAATAPYAQKIAAQTQANQQQIQNMLPAGGQKQLALAQNQIGQGQSIANLYQGLGPQAAAQLTQLAQAAGGQSVAAGGTLTNLAGTEANAKSNVLSNVIRSAAEMAMA